LFHGFLVAIASVDLIDLMYCVGRIEQYTIDTGVWQRLEKRKRVHVMRRFECLVDVICVFHARIETTLIRERIDPNCVFRRRIQIFLDEFVDW